jgi:hypothetical protein
MPLSQQTFDATQWIGSTEKKGCENNYHFAIVLALDKRALQDRKKMPDM